MRLRPQNDADTEPIRTLVRAAFRDAAHSNGTEASIVDALRAGDALTLSLVAVDRDCVVGHVAFSPVTIAGKPSGWFGLGPIAVERGRQRQGIGRQLIQAGLQELKKRGAGGCVVLGDPAFYARFGFRSEPALTLAGAPADYFQCLRLQGERPTGEVTYHPAFARASGAPPRTPRQRASGLAMLNLQRRGAATALADLRQEGCLKIRFPRGPHRTPTLLNSSGGVAGGDRLHVRAMLGPGAEASISTQAAERIYRALPDDPPSHLRTRLDLAEGAALDWLPQETILFDGCALDRQLDVTMHGSAQFLGIEILVFGRAAMGEVVRSGTVRDRIDVRRDRTHIFRDSIRLHGGIADTLDRPAVARGQRVVATLLLVAPDAEARLDAVRAALSGQAAEGGASAWNGMLVARMLAAGSWSMRGTVLACLAALGRQPPRVWAC